MTALPPFAPRRAVTVAAALVIALALNACKPPPPVMEEQEQALDKARQAAAEVAAKSNPEPTLAPLAGSCDVSQVQGLIGQPYSAELAEQARQDTGASQVRALKPGQAMTLDFAGGRLNIELDENDKITGVRCG